MGWEYRRGIPYYYQAMREDGRVRKKYIGTGDIAETIAHADETIRRARHERRAQGLEELDRLEALGAPVLELDEAGAILARAALVAGGFHRYKGEWRLRRERSD